MDIIEQCKASLERLYNCRDNLKFLMDNAPAGEKDGEKEIKHRFNGYEDQFIEAMEDDLNTADALSALFDFARDINSTLNAAAAPSKELCEYAYNLYMELAGVLGLLYNVQEDSLDEEIEACLLYTSYEAGAGGKGF